MRLSHPLVIWIATLYQTWFAQYEKPPPARPLTDPTQALSETLRSWRASVMAGRGSEASGPYMTTLDFYVREHDSVEVMAKFLFENGAQSDCQWRAMICSRADLPRSVAKALDDVIVDGRRSYLWPSD